MLYRITDGTVSLGGEVILSHIDFEIKGREKIALTGRNGAGKTTLLRLIAGELELDRDDRRQGPGVLSSRELTVGFLRQTDPVSQDRTVDQFLLSVCPAEDPYSRERYLYEMEYDRIFTGFGFRKEDKHRPIGSFSGGEQTRIRLIHLLLQKPDILLLDEPTNHLDIAAAQWLEGYLQEYDKAVIMVSHDRFFLDQTAEIVYELEDGKLTRYTGNFTAYRLQKRKWIADRTRAWERQQAELAHMEELVEKFKHKPRKAAFARSRRTLMDRVERIEKPAEEESHIFTGPIDPLIPGAKWVIEAQHLKIGYDRPLLELSLRVRRGQKIAVIGDNGVGKTTFLKTLAGQTAPLEGSLVLGNDILMGYFDQMTAALQSEKTVAQHFGDLFPAMTDKEVRQTLGAWLFAGKEASRKVSDLSGGEKSRLLLCELLVSRPNLLLLDEPTNHMDIPARETLESALGAYTGTILFVSHDRYFVSQVADAILEFRGSSAFYCPFGYEHYLAHCRKEEETGVSARVTAENQALIAGLKAVPKGEKHMLREIRTEDAYVDWRLSLAGEPLRKAERAYEQYWERLQEEERLRQEKLLENFGQPEAAEEVPAQETGPEAEWTKACLEWYTVFLELQL